MTKLNTWLGLAASCWLSLPLLSLANQADEQNNSTSGEEIPDQALLEFLANFGDIDDETFDLIIYHGKNDLEKTDELTTKQEPNHEP